MSLSYRQPPFSHPHHPEVLFDSLTGVCPKSIIAGYLTLLAIVGIVVFNIDVVFDVVLDIVLE